MMPVFVQGRISPALKGLAVGTYVIHLAAQVLDLQTSLPPSTLLFPRSYSPNGYFLSAFSALSAALNIMWLKELLFERNNDDPDVIPSFVYEKDLENVHNASQGTEELALPHDLERHQSVSFKSTYLPIYIIGNILLCTLQFLCDDSYSLFGTNQVYLLSRPEMNFMIFPIISLS